MGVSPGYPSSLTGVDSGIPVTNLPDTKYPISPYGTLPTKFIHFKPTKRDYQAGRFTSNKSRNSSNGYYFTTNYHQPVSKLQAQVKSAFKHPHTFFDYVPAEVRNNIYGSLIDGFIVSISALVYAYSASTEFGDPINQARTMQHVQNHAISASKHETKGANFMCVSRQFFHEIKDVLHRDMIVVFSRRWDFLNACGTHNLYQRHAFPIHNTELLLFPPSPNIFDKIRQLSLDLSGSSDFGHRIVTAEVERVTSLLLKMVAANLPDLRSLTLRVNDVSRISFVEGVFLPEPSFLESLIAIRQIKNIRLLPGMGWRGNGPRQNVFQHNLAAFELLMQRHFSGLCTIELHDFAGSNRWVRLANIGRLMLSVKDLVSPINVKSYTHAMNLIQHKVYAIEHGARRWAVLLLKK